MTGLWDLSSYLFSKHHEVIGLMFYFKDLITFYFMCMRICLHVCMCTTCMSCACRGQKKASGLLGLEIRVVMSHLWVLGIQPGSPKRVSTVLKHRAAYSSIYYSLPVTMFCLAWAQTMGNCMDTDYGLLKSLKLRQDKSFPFIH